MNPTPYIFFNGNCAEAMRTYERILGGKLQMMTYGEAPDGCPANVQPDRIMHANIAFSGGFIMASDDESGQPYRGMHGFAVTIEYPTVAETKRVFDALAEKGQIMMPFGKTFWSEGFGGVIDRFGTPWMISTASAGAPTK